jgi:hypothetical protein
MAHIKKTIRAYPSSMPQIHLKEQESKKNGKGAKDTNRKRHITSYVVGSRLSWSESVQGNCQAAEAPHHGSEGK